MSTGEVFSFLGLMIASITFGGMALSAYRHRLDFKARALEARARIAEAEAGRRANLDVDVVEERLRVLERIATDRKQVLAEEIEALRDERTPA